MHKARKNSVLKRSKKKLGYFILFEALAFLLAALIHKGILVQGYAHYVAGIAESVIAGVLITGLLLTRLQPGWTRTLGLAVQGFAFLGTVVGIATIIIGIGPATVPDVIYHVTILAILGTGIYFALQLPRR